MVGWQLTVIFSTVLLDETPHQSSTDTVGHLSEIDRISLIIISLII